MNAVTNERFKDWINPEMLVWARKWRGFTLEEAAEKIKKPVEKLASWEANETTPTVLQARKLAEVYGRSFMEFFLKSPPSIHEPDEIPDFRLHKDILSLSLERETKFIVEWAIAQRDSALDLYGQLNAEPTTFPQELSFTTKEPPEKAAELARRYLQFSRADQFDLRKSESYKLPEIIRDRVEQHGALTLRNTRLGKYGIRGFCIAKFPLPTIVIGREAPTAQAFTIAHELGHIVLHASGISGPRREEYDQIPEERWCDRFAAAFLMPKNLIEQSIGLAPADPAMAIEDERLSALANQFKVSPHAMLIRLVHLGYVIPSYYWAVKKDDFEHQDSEYKSFGRPKFYGTRYQSANGKLLTSLVIEAMSNGRLSNHNAAEHLGIKNLKHLYDIKHDLGNA